MFQGKHKNFLGTASHRTHPFLELLKCISRSFPRRSKAGSLKNRPRNLGALSNLNVFLSNSPIRELSGTVLRTTRNKDSKNREPNGDRSQNDSHPTMEFFACQNSTQTQTQKWHQAAISHKIHEIISGPEWNDNTRFSKKAGTNAKFHARCSSRCRPFGN